MSKSPYDPFIVRRPDYIPEGEEHLYPHIGGVFHDFIPEGQDGLTMHGYTEDATVDGPTREAALEPKKPRGKKR